MKSTKEHQQGTQQRNSICEGSEGTPTGDKTTQSVGSTEVGTSNSNVQ